MIKIQLMSSNIDTPGPTVSSVSKESFPAGKKFEACLSEFTCRSDQFFSVDFAWEVDQPNLKKVMSVEVSDIDSGFLFKEMRAEEATHQKPSIIYVQGFTMAVFHDEEKTYIISGGDETGVQEYTDYFWVPTEDYLSEINWIEQQAKARVELTKREL